MKTIITAVLLIGLTAISCKKEVQTTTPTDVDTVPAMDSMNMNSSPMPADTMNAIPSSDSMNSKRTDSSAATPK